MRKLSIVAFVILSLSLGFLLFYKKTSVKKPPSEFFPGAKLSLDNKKAKETDLKSNKDIKVIAENLKIPWEIVFLPDKRILITERPGTVKILTPKGDDLEYKVDEVYHYGEGGLLGAAVHPDFEKNNFIYLYLTYRKNNEILNKVVRYRLENNRLNQDKIIIDNIKGAIFHDGGRIEFGPDGYLYITTGDATQPELSQDPSNLNGKILRLSDEGDIPPDNPFGNPVYSYGHRNPQGLAWDSSGQLWITEHGPSGALSGFDEVNKILPGENYGWPDIIGDKSKEGMRKPFVHSGAEETWAPAGAVFYKDYLIFAGLRGSSLYRLDIKTKEIKPFFKDKFGRLRAVVMGPDGYLYISTSNTDGRGKARKGDDKIIRINPKLLED